MKIGLLLSRTGLMGLWSPVCEAAASAAAAEINADGGVLDAEVRLFYEDAGGTSETAFAATRKLIFERNVDAIVGFQASYTRPAVRAAAGGLAPYIYTPQYEGGFTGPGSVAIGMTDREVLDPGIAWLSERKRARRVFFLGNDYIWPRRARRVAGQSISAAGGCIVGEMLVPLACRDQDAILDRIRAAKPDLVICALLGQDAVAFNRAFARAGLASRILRLTLAFEETLLYGVGSENAENLFAVQPFFAHSDLPHRGRMLDIYARYHLHQMPPMTVNAMNVYDSVHLAARLARSVRRFDGCLMAARLDRRFDRNEIFHFLGQPEIARHGQVHIGEADGTQFRIHEYT